MGYYREQQNAELARRYKQLPAADKLHLETNLPRRETEQRKQIYSSSMREVLKEAKEFAKEWKKTLEDVSLDHYHYDDYGSTSSQLDMTVSGLETDDQYYKRLMEHHDATRVREEYERKEFERLSAKFSGRGTS
jgi:hypothetical protein